MKNPGTPNKYFYDRGTIPYTRFIIALVCFVINYTNNIGNLGLYCLYYIYRGPRFPKYVLWARCK